MTDILFTTRNFEGRESLHKVSVDWYRVSTESNGMKIIKCSIEGNPYVFDNVCAGSIKEVK